MDETVRAHVLYAIEDFHKQTQHSWRRCAWHPRCWKRFARQFFAVHSPENFLRRPSSSTRVSRYSTAGVEVVMKKSGILIGLLAGVLLAYQGSVRAQTATVVG